MGHMQTKDLKKIMAVTVILAAACSIVYSQIEDQFGPIPVVRREVTVYWTTTPPKIDGELSDEVWQSLPRTTGMVDIGYRHSYVDDQAFFSMCYDDKNIYIGVECLDSFPEKIKPTVTERDDSNLFNEETFEFFFDEDRTGKNVKQLVVNPIGTQFDIAFDNGKYLPDWSGKWTSAGRRTLQGWSVELAVPFTTLGVSKPEPGDKWRGNYARTQNTSGGDPYSSWSVVTAAFNSPREFGYWVFADPSQVPDRGEEMTINREFMQDAHQKLEDVIRQVRSQITLIERIPVSVGPAWIAEKRKSIEVDVVKLNTKLSERTNLDNFLETYLAGIKLKKEVDEIDLALSRLDLTGVVSLPVQPKPGIQREGSYWFLTSTEAIFALDAENGSVAGIWELPSRQRLVSVSYELYTLETMTMTKNSEERVDRINKTTRSESGLKFICTNPDIPGVTITKDYLLESNGRILTKRVSVTASAKEKTIFSSSTNTVFDEGYRTSAYYNRVLTCAATGGADPRPTVLSTAIDSKMIQRAGFNQPSGWSQFLLVNPKTGNGIAQYLYKIDDEYVWIPYSVKSSYWNPSGWEMSFMATFLNSAPFTSEMRYHLFPGDQVAFYHEYLSLPEVRAARDDIKVNPAIAHMRYEGQGDGLMCALMSGFPDKFPRFSVPHSRLRSDEVTLQAAALPNHSRFSHWPNNDMDFFIANNPPPYGHEQRTQAAEVKKAITHLKKYFPRSLMGVNYWFHTDIHPETDFYRKYPEFAIAGKDGKPLPSIGPYGAYEADMGVAFTAAAVKEYTRMVDYLGLRYIYFDNFGGLAVPDWGEGKVVQATDYIHFLKSMRLMLEERKGFLFLNGDTGHLYTDVSFAESMNSIKFLEEHVGKEWWRPVGERLMQYKLFERDGSSTILLFWTDYRKGPEAKGDDTGREYTNLILSLGMRPHTCYYDYNVELKREDGVVDWSAMYNYEEAYHQATLEMQGTRLVDPELKPAYWRDFETKIEAYVLKLGQGFFFTANNHYPETRDTVLISDVDKLGFSPARRTFFWNYTRRDDQKVDRLDGPGLTGPGKPGWDRLFTEIRCQSKILPANEKRLNIEMTNLEPNLTRVATVTQVPGFIYSVEGQRTQFLIPETLGCKIAGELDEVSRTSILRVDADKPLQILAWWPQEWGETKAHVLSGEGRKIIGQEEIGKTTYGKEQFLIISLPKGETKVILNSLVVKEKT